MHLNNIINHNKRIKVDKGEEMLKGEENFSLHKKGKKV